MDISENSELKDISARLDSAMTQLKKADAEGDTHKATEIANDYKYMQDLYS